MLSLRYFPLPEKLRKITHFSRLSKISDFIFFFFNPQSPFYPLI